MAVSNIVKKWKRTHQCSYDFFNLKHLVSERSKIHDHTILIIWAAFSPFVAANDISHISSTLEKNTVRPQRYRFNSKPDAFMNNNVSKADMANILCKMKAVQL